MNKYTIIVTVVVLGCLAFVVNNTYHLSYPEYFPEPEYNFKNNPLTKEKITLGQALFYDPILSKDTMVSCASCHNPYNAFAHTDHDLSHGINDQIGKRNAPALFNLAWHSSFNWDGAINHLDMQALAPIEDPREMGEKFDSVVYKLNESELYRKLFYNAFQDSTVTGEHILKALSQFQLTLISADAKYDKVKRGEATFTDQEQNGYKLFQKNCASCHSEPLFTNHQFANNGLPIDTTLNDFGKMNITNKKEDAHKFKIPTLRNLEYTFPYMHDGRFNSLSKAVKHYVTGIEVSENLASQLQDSLKLSSNERVDLIAFLLTLTDKDFVFDPKHQFPREILLEMNK